MIRFALTSVFLILLAPALAADFVRLVPPAPDSNDSIEVKMGGSWRNGCVPTDPVVTRVGTEISITLSTGSKDCTAVITAWRADATLAPLPPGFYTLNVFLPLENEPTPSLGKSLQFPVTEAEVEFRILPSAGAIQGGYEITILGPFGACGEAPACPLPGVSFDGQPAVSIREVPLGVAVTVPPHAKGTADVLLTSRDGGPLDTISAGFYFYDPSAVPDPAAFKPILFPVFFEGAGAQGSNWTTDAWVYNRGQAPVLPLNADAIFVCPAMSETCASEFLPKETLRIEHGSDRRDRGLLLYVPRSQEEDLDYSLHIRDLSRQADSAGTDIPVISEEDLEEDFLQLLNVPVADRFRQTLRIFSLDGNTGSRVQVEAFPMTGDSESLGLAVLTLGGSTDCEGEDCRPLEPASVVLNDFRAAFPDLGDAERVRIDIRPVDEALRLWGFISVTNNVTQEVTTVTPH